MPRYLEVVARPVPAKRKRRYRCVLLFRADDGGAEPSAPAPWSVLAADGAAPGDGDDEERRTWLPGLGERVLLPLPAQVDNAFFWKLAPAPAAGGDSTHVLEQSRVKVTGDVLDIHAFGGLEPIHRQDPEATVEELLAFRGNQAALLHLIEAFRFPGGLDEYAAADDAQLVSCLSYLVFEVEMRTGAKLAPPAGPAPSLELRGDAAAVTIDGQSYAEEREQPDTMEVRWSILPEQGDPLPLPVDAEQRADGIFFTVHQERFLDDFPAGQRPAPDELKLELYRSVGAAPTATPLLLKSEVWDFQGVVMEGDDASEQAIGRKYQLIDPLAADALVGEMLHYRIDVVGALGTRIGGAEVTLRRRRLDPPPPPSTATATMTLDSTGVDLAATWPESLDGRTVDFKEAFVVEAYADRRPLDECGYYGGDDDLALEEGLVEADIAYDAGAEADAGPAPGSGDSLAAQLRGRYDREHLTKVAIEAAEWSVSGTTVTARLTLGEELTPGTGYRFYLGVARLDAGERVAESLLVVCDHAVRVRSAAGAAEAKTLRVFQLERFTRGGTGPFWLPAEDVRLELLSAGGVATAPETLRKADPDADLEGELAPLGVQVAFAQPRAGLDDLLSPDGKRRKAPPIGGVRILVRDALGDNDGRGFEALPDVQVLPELVARYRPLQLEYGLPARVPGRAGASRLAGGFYLLRDPAPAPTAAADGDALGGARKSLQAAAETLRGELGLRATMPEPERAAGQEPEESASTDDRWIEAAEEDLAFDLRPFLSQIREEVPAGLGGPAMDTFFGDVAADDAGVWGLFGEGLPVHATIGRDAAIAPPLPANATSYLEQFGSGTARAAAEAEIDRIQTRLLWSWEVWGRASALLRKGGLTRDFRVPVDRLRGFWASLEGTDLGPVRILALATAEGQDTATIRLMPMLEPSLVERLVEKLPANLRRLYRTAFGASRLVALKFEEDPGAAHFLTMGAGRRVRAVWNGLTDFWHHDLEFAIACEDRYYRIRELLDEPGGEPAAAPVVPPGAVRRITVPRLEPAPALGGVLPVPDPDRVAYRLLDAPQRREASYNALSRVRYGTLQTRLEPRFTFDIEPYLGADPDPATGPLHTLSEMDESDMASAWSELLAGLCDEAPDMPEAGGWRQDSAGIRFARPGEADLIRIDGAHQDVVEFADFPHFLTHRLSAWIDADYLSGPAASAETSRRAGGLGLEAMPSATVEEVQAEGGESVAAIRLSIRLVPALLRSHLTESERKALRRLGSGGHGPPLRDFLDDAHAAWNIPVEMLPDLKLRYRLFLNVGEGGVDSWLPLLGVGLAPTADGRRTGPFGLAATAADGRSEPSVRFTHANGLEIVLERTPDSRTAQALRSGLEGNASRLLGLVLDHTDLITTVPLPVPVSRSHA